jgi:glycosyltransferase involved in cell wall biosynthesis
MSEFKRTILTFTCFYLPGYKGGGPIRTIVNTVEILGDEFDFKIVTLDRDLGSDEPYPGVKVNEWQQVGKAQVLYVAPGMLGFSYVRQIINSTPHNVLYLNSYFSPEYTILPLLLRRLGLISTSEVIVAPRGEFSIGALRLKRFKKQSFIFLAQLFGLYDKVHWQASSKYEEADIINALRIPWLTEKQCLISIASQIIIAPDLSHHEKSISEKSVSKVAGRLSIVFLSRLSQKKNLDGALKMLRDLKGNVTFNIFGPREDLAYWEKCQGIIDTLPANIHVDYVGMVSHDKVAEVFKIHDIFLFPTHGENFGHVISEALVAGCPPLISNQTPWRDLELEGVGWDISLTQPEKFTEVLQRCVDMDCAEMREFCLRAIKYGRKRAQDESVVLQNRHLFSICKNICIKEE